MESLFTLQNIVSGIAILSALFMAYNSIRTPDEKADKSLALLAEQIKTTNELISQRINFSEQGTDRRFKDMQDNFTQLVTTQQNHIHTVETKVDALVATNGTFTEKLVALTTIIDERIPKK